MDIDYLCRNYEYDRFNGKVFQIMPDGVHRECGTECNGYLRTSVSGQLTYNHRIAWALFYKEEPPKYIDHKNRNRQDNRIENLRACTLSQNQTNRNLSKNNTTGYTGVTFISRLKKYKATIYKNNKPIYLGVFATVEDASNAYMKAKEMHHEMV